MIERVRIEKSKRIMREFRIEELSAVDRPAQAHAKMAIMKRDDPDRDDILKLVHRPMNGAEQQHYAKLVGAERRQFVQADHDQRKRLMTEDHNEVSTMKSFGTFEDAVVYLKKNGMGSNAAMTAARKARPDLLKSMQERRHEPTTEEEFTKAARDGRSRQNQMQAAVDEMALTKGVSKTEAMRLLRREQPEMFE